MAFARRVFRIAGIYGLIVLFPQYFMESKVGQDYPPPITHPEYFYGFIGTALAFQILFLLISKDPVRYRAAMPIAILEKLVWGIPCVVLYMQHRIALVTLAFGLVDFFLAVLFFAAYRASRNPSPASRY